MMRFDNPHTGGETWGGVRGRPTDSDPALTGNLTDSLAEFLPAAGRLD